MAFPLFNDGYRKKSEIYFIYPESKRPHARIGIELFSLFVQHKGRLIKHDTSYESFFRPNRRSIIVNVTAEIKLQTPPHRF